LLDRYDVCRRTDDGFLHLVEAEPQFEKFIGKMRALWQQMTTEGYLDGAVEVLRQNGYEALKNSVGDISVRPPVERLPAV
jgi:hypothetical protein